VGKQVIQGRAATHVSRHLRWESFAARIQEGPPSLEPIKGAPRTLLFIEPGGSRIGIRFYTDSADLPTSPLAEVAVRLIGIGSQQMVEVSTSNSALFRDFYSFCCTLADRVQLDRRPVGVAISETLRSWSTLLRHRPLLSIDTQCGLVGELLFLRRLADATGWVAAVSSWQGPGSQEHDFTLENKDIEVKTTMREHRVHHIDSLTQLVPKVNRPLILISIQLTPSSGKGSFSLAQMVATVLTTASSKAPQSVQLIRDQLRRIGWADSDADHYTSSYQLRSEFAAVPVNEFFPAIVPATLEAMGPHLTARIEHLSYSIAVDGLGMLDGSKAFNKIVFSR
jgi:hypothetical protein